MLNLEAIGQIVRGFIWRIIFIVFVAVSIHGWIEAGEALNAFEEPQAFWPPDLVPHPGAPHPIPEHDPSDPQDERNWA